MQTDKFKNTTDSLIASARDCFEIVPSNTAEIAKVTKAIYVGNGGDITVHAIDSVTDVTFTNVPTGTILPVRASHIRANGTTATGIIGLA